MEDKKLIYGYGTEKFLFSNEPDNNLDIKVFKMYFKLKSEFKNEINNKEI